jgi:hypothetical protein
MPSRQPRCHRREPCCLPMMLETYLKLVNWSGLQIRNDKRLLQFSELRYQTAENTRNQAVRAK